MDLCRAFLNADIPLYKLNNPGLKSFLENYTKKKLPNESTIRRKCVSKLYEEIIEKIRSEIGQNPIWVSLDESTDVDGRCIGNVVVGSMNPDGPSKAFLLACEEMPKCNHQTVAKLFNDSLSILWRGEIKHDRVFLFVTDAAPYMCKTAKALQVLFPKMIHLTCLDHALHRVAEHIRIQYNDIDNLISSVKKIFFKSPYRIKFLKEKYPEIPLPSKPLLTRWGSWPNAASYYADYYNEIKTVLTELQDDAKSIYAAKKLLLKTNIHTELAYIKSNFSFLCSRITQLENSNLSLEEALNILDTTVNQLSNCKGVISEKVNKKVELVLKKNPG